jgi:hypothetical protein
MSKRYSERDIIEQGNYYSRHTSAMTGEGLHSKSAIAADLKAEDRAERLYRRSLARHPDCNDPDHPGCANCEPPEDFEG